MEFSRLVASLVVRRGPTWIVELARFSRDWRPGFASCGDGDARHARVFSWMTEEIGHRLLLSMPRCAIDVTTYRAMPATFIETHPMLFFILDVDCLTVGERG